MSTEKTRYLCKTCGWIYDEAKGDPDSGIAPGTPFEEIPDDWYCPLCGVGKADFVAMDQMAKPAIAAPIRKRAKGKAGGDDAIVIVGSGVAGWTVAEELRQLGNGQPITMITADDGSYYPKPALSMALGQERRPESLIEQEGMEKAAVLNVVLQNHTRVLNIKPKLKRLLTAKGNVKYQKLILALGASQIKVPMEGSAADQVLRVNDLASYKNFHTRLHDPKVQHVTIIGGGLVGSEFAEDIRSTGKQVTIVDLGERLLSRLLPPLISQRLRESFVRKGIEFISHATVKALEPAAPAGFSATLSNGATIHTDMVISAVGLRANVDLAKKAGMHVGRGIVTHAATMETSMSDIYALGDCAELDGKLYAYIEPIKRQAQTLAQGIMGEPTAFAHRPVNIRVKTPSLPVQVCLPAVEKGEEHWQVINQSPTGVYMEQHRAGTLVGYALCGDYAGLAPTLNDMLGNEVSADDMERRVFAAAS